MAQQRFDADAIVVGAGSAGAVAARRLVDAGLNVLLLEAGGVDTSEAIHDPARAHELWFAPEDWGYHTVPQPHADDRRLHWPRGKVLGGSSCLNAMIYVRGAAADFDSWAYMGCPGWTWDDVLPVYVRMEDFDRGASDWHGAGGPLRVKADYPRNPLHEAIGAAAGESGIPFNDDYNGPGGQDGFSYCQLTIDREGIRHSSARAYLGPVLDNPRLTVLTHAHARRLIIDDGRCCGVEWERDGNVECGYADGEVIVSTGTIESPRLLMLSGIGPADHLTSVGVDVVHDLPGVGENLHDHLLSPLIFSAERAIPPPAPGCQQAQSHFFWRSRPGLAVPDVQPLAFSVPLYEEWMDGPENAFSLMAGMIRPASRGTIRLRSSDPWDELDIDPRVLSARADVDTLVTAVEKCREVGAAPALREWGARELYPGPGTDLEAWVRRTAITYHHQVGTCRMGSDVMAVVDPELRVHSIEGLRVADASIMPTVTTGNTNAPALMIGERVADFVLGSRPARVAAGTTA